jgi:hypothetical protein
MAEQTVLLQLFAASRARYKPFMAKRRQATQVRQNQSFKGQQFTAEVILWAVRWYLMFPISYRDLELMHTGSRRQGCECRPNGWAYTGIDIGVAPRHPPARRD